ncbi:hypothetical protein EDD11_006347 [Mortierella claussenii]|nr:hypothetical protein EDD11_006347 [Mortierella claussenii]
MGQSFNLQGILQTFRVLASPRLMVPNLVVRDIRDINFEQLHKSGIIAIGFDKDNCLTKPYGQELHPPFKDAWKRCKDTYKDQIVIVSNSAGTNDDKDHRLAQQIEQTLQVHVLRHRHKKPSGGEELLKHFSGIKPARIAFVGDRALTDVVFGNNHGMLTILTRDVVTEEGDNAMAVRIRKLEHRVLAFLDRMNIRQKAHPIEIDLRAVVMQQPPAPETKEEIKAQAVIDQARTIADAKKAEAEAKATAKQAEKDRHRTTSSAAALGSTTLDSLSSSSSSSPSHPLSSASHSSSQPYKAES